MILLQLLINALSLGSFYSLVALGFALIFGVTHTFNLAHGELILLSGYFAYFLVKYWHLPFIWTLPACMLCLATAAVLLRKLLKQVQPPYELNTLVVTFGLALVLQNVMLILFSANYRLIPSIDLPSRLTKSAVNISEAQMTNIVVSLVATIFLHLFLRKTLLGKALRATIQDREAAKLVGIHVGRMSLIAFLFAGALIGLAGPLYARSAYLQPAGGTEATLIAIVITIFAGVGRTRTVLLGGWALGIAESLSVYLLGSGWRELVSAVFLISLLILKPQGLLPRRARSRR